MQLKEFSHPAKSLAKNPLGIIALFIVMVYAIAGLVINFAGPEFYQSHYHPAVIFLVIFPLCVLSVFAYLVSRHHEKLYSPKDYANPDDFAKTFSVQTRQGTEIAMTDEESRLFIKDTFDALIDAFNDVLTEMPRKQFWRIIEFDRPVVVSELIPDFDRKNEEHLGVLRALRGMALIKLEGGGTWRPDSRILLTEFGRKLAKHLEQ